ncbi:MAG TPA: hypothetical protein VGC11_02895 [Acidimicrobiia bacterium]
MAATFLLGILATPVTGAVLDKLDCNGCIDAHDIHSNAVKSGKIKDGAVGKEDLDKKAVTRSKIKDGAVSMSKIGSGSIMAARVNSNGTLISGTEGVTSERSSTGIYLVTFPVDVNDCVMTANHVGEAQDGVILALNATGRVAASSVLPNAALVHLWQPVSGAYVDGDIMAIMICP